MSIIRHEDFSINKVHRMMFGRGFLRPLSKGNYITRTLRTTIPTACKRTGNLIKRKEHTCPKGGYHGRENHS